MKHIWWFGRYALAMPRDNPTRHYIGQKPARSYLYLIKDDFRDVKFKIQIRRRRG